MLNLSEWGLLFATMLFAVGACGFLFRRNLLLMLLGVEIMLNASNLALVSASRLTKTIDGQVLVFFVMAIAACEAAIGLAMIISLHRKKATTDADDLRLLRG